MTSAIGGDVFARDKGGVDSHVQDCSTKMLTLNAVHVFQPVRDQYGCFFVK